VGGGLVGSGLGSTGGKDVGGTIAAGTQALKPIVKITARRKNFLFIAILTIISFFS
jgi:hypothetical protein